MTPTVERQATRPANSSAVVAVERITRLSTSGPLKAFASVDIGGRWKIHDCRVVQQDGKAAWVSLPQGSYERDGKKRWYPIVEVPDTVKNAIQDAVLAAWEAGE